MLNSVFVFVFKSLLGVVLLTLVYNLYLVVRYFKIFKFAWTAHGIWYPRFPFVGNLYAVLFIKTKISVISALLWAIEYTGMPLSIWFGERYVYVSNNAEEARIILNHPKCYNKSELYHDLHCIFKNSILLLPSDIWKPRRHYLRSAFKPNMVKNFYWTFHHQSCLLIRKIEQVAPTEDLFKFFKKYSFTNFFLTSTGMDIENADTEIEQFGALFDSIQDEFVKILLNPVIPAFVWMRTPLGARLKSLLRAIKNILNVIVMKRKKLCTQVSEYVSGSTDVLLIDLLLSDAYKKNTERDIVEEFTLFSAAATDTTGHTLAFCFTLLGMHPQEQQKVYEEVISSIGDHAVDDRNIQQLKYTEAVICETLRIFPSIPIFGRWCAEDVNLGTKVIPKGANFMVSAYHIHRNPDYWKDPLRYEPARFLPGNASKIVPGSYLPFSEGLRNCIGKDMAMALLKITVANVVRAYRITSRHKSLDEFCLESCISMKTSNHMDCNFIPRT